MQQLQASPENFRCHQAVRNASFCIVEFADSFLAMLSCQFKAVVNEWHYY